MTKISKLRELEARKLLAECRGDEQINNIDLIDRLATILTGTPGIVTIAAASLKDWNQYGENSPKFTFNNIGTEDYYETMSEVVLNSAATYRGMPIEENLADVQDTDYIYSYDETLSAVQQAAVFLDNSDLPYASTHANDLRNVAKTLQHNHREVTPDQR